MIPVKIELQNFLAYSEPAPLDFTGLHVACLVGPNGAGKSSLLDAITWALWGKARASHDDLVRLGETEMWVKLTFTFGKNTYRVARYRSKEGRGSSDLVLEIQGEDGERWTTISESTIRATQAKINTILRLDYDTFVNSAFLAQGRADQFTSTMRPSERKELLAEILNLNMWADYEDRTKAKLKELEVDIGQTDEAIATIDADLAREAEYQRELIEAQRHSEAIRDRLDEAQARLREAQEHRSEWEKVRVQHEGLERSIANIDDELGRIAEDYDERAAQFENLRERVAQQEAIMAGYDRLQAARQEDAALRDRLKAHSSLREAISQLHHAIEQERMRIQGELNMARQRWEDLAREIDEAPTQDEFDKTMKQIADLEALEEKREEAMQHLNALKEQRATLVGTNDMLKAEMNGLKEQQTTLKETQSAECPVCGQELNEAHRLSLIEELQVEGERKAATYRQNQEKITTLADEAAELEAIIKRMAPEIKQLGPLQGHLQTMQIKVERLEERQAEADTLAERITGYEAMLDEGNYAVEARAELAALQEEMADLGYDDTRQEELNTIIDEHAGYERQKAELDTALERLPVVEEALTNLEERRAVLEGRREQAYAEAAAYRERLAELDELLVGFEELEAEVSNLWDDHGNAKQAVGMAEQRVNALDANRQRREVLVARRGDLAEEKAIYEDLRRAFGKDGVPAMVIETAIPEIEQEANQLLGRMTDGRMHVRFDTQREKKTGGAMETLDIRIADELGTRDYATFSGGEAFRVNFAIRLALSRMLARRAGAQLRTLIIDEGFGTQDAFGRERLVQAINAVQDEFDLLLVITHIDELKDAFPARIEVTKLSDGSVVEII